MLAVILFITAVAGGIVACMTRSLVLLLVILVLEIVLVQTVSVCRGYERVWEFAFFSGTMLPVHLFWFFPFVISSGALGAFGIATVFMILYGLFSVELLLVISLTHFIAGHRVKSR